MRVPHMWYVRFRAQEIAVQKDVSSHVTAAATVLEAVQVREYLKINVLGTIPYFVDGNVKILRQHIQIFFTWECAAACSQFG